MCLRRRPNEGWVDSLKRTGVIAARQLKKHNQQRVQTLAMRRVRIAAWQMVTCPSDAKGRRYWEESVTWRCDELWRDEYIRLSKEDYRNSTQWKRPLPGRPNYWERPFTRFLGDAWIPKLKACNTWTESLRVLAMSLLNVQIDHVMTVIPGMLHGHQIRIVVWRFWVATRL